MASVPLNFLPPINEDIVKLFIYEAPTPTGPWTNIETVTSIGSYPAYISHYTTNLATSINYWFVIQWEDAKGARTAASEPVQGNTSLLLQDIIDMVMLRDPSLNENVIAQEAQAVIEQLFHVDAFTLFSDDATMIQKTGITYLVMARSILVEIATSQESDYVAGIISQKMSSSTLDPTKRIQYLVKAAEQLLGINYSVILQLAPLETDQGRVVGIDQSRLLVEFL